MAEVAGGKKSEKPKVDVFIGYKGFSPTEPDIKDSEFIKDLSTYLEHHGVQTWYYERDSPGGRFFPAVIADVISKTPVELFILSRRSITSPQLFVEVTQACNKRNNLVIPVLHNITHAEFEKTSPAWVAQFGARTYRKSSECKEILNDIISYENPDSPTIISPGPSRWTGGKRVPILVGGLIVGIILFALVVSSIVNPCLLLGLTGQPCLSESSLISTVDCTAGCSEPSNRSDAPLFLNSPFYSDCISGKGRYIINNFDNKTSESCTFDYCCGATPPSSNLNHWRDCIKKGGTLTTFGSSNNSTCLYQENGIWYAEPWENDVSTGGRWKWRPNV